MRNLYARFVLWLIRPALELRERKVVQTFAVDVSRTSAEQWGEETGRQMAAALRRLDAEPHGPVHTYSVYEPLRASEGDRRITRPGQARPDGDAPA